MRYKRLREKIEKELGSGAVKSPNVNTPAQQPDAGKAKKAKATHKKRKAPDDEDAKESSINGGLSQLDGQIDTPTLKRQTRGVRLNFDVKACYSSDDDSSSLSSLRESDSECISDGKPVKIKDENLSTNEGETDIKPEVKRVKKSPSLPSVKPVTPAVQPPRGTQLGGNQKTPGAGRATILKANLNTVPRTATTAKKQASSKTAVVKKMKATSKMHVSQKPLPSVESSPPPYPSNMMAPAKSGKSVGSEESDIDIRSFKPGTLLTFPSQRQRKQTQEALFKPGKVSSAVATYVAITSSPSSPQGPETSIASSVSSSHDSAGMMLKESLESLVQLTEVQPGESASNPGGGTVENTFGPPPTPAGK